MGRNLTAPPSIPPDVRITYPAVRQMESPHCAHRAPRGNRSVISCFIAVRFIPASRPRPAGLAGCNALDLRHGDFTSLSIPSRGTVRAFSRLCGCVPSPLPDTPSADFSTVFSAGCPTPSRTPLLACCTGEISRGKTRHLHCANAGFTKHTPTADGGLRGQRPTRPGCITPHIRFLFIAPQFRIGLPPHPASRRRTCPSPCLRLCENLATGLSPAK